MSSVTVVERPLDIEICTGCGNPIIRNKAYLDKDPYHFGCLKKSEGKPSHQCLSCWAYLTGAGINKVFLDGLPLRACGNCGSFDLRPLTRWKKEDS